MHLSATQIMSRQARSVVSGSMRQGSVRVAAAPTRQQARLASTSTAATSSTSSPSSSASKRAVPIAFLAAAAAAVTGYAVTSRSPLMAEESAKRKNYYERMKVEERKQQEEAKATEEAPSSEEGEVASPATEDLAEQASQESAFDPETNTINWDCPCLGGMAHGPCGEEFKKAFSCFVFSEEEPKGIDCVDNFKGMQDCFRKYPEHYKEELEDEEDFERQSSGEQDGQAKSASAGGGGDNGDEEEDEGIREFRREMNKE